jgi:DMSO/TMAO reductase YedYZ molybdopterin-dependent catalytic subunit
MVTGLVKAELTLTTADPSGLEVVKVTAEHPKSGPGDYEGVRLNAVLEKAGLQDGAGAIVISASDGFTTKFPWPMSKPAPTAWSGLPMVSSTWSCLACRANPGSRM